MIIRKRLRDLHNHQVTLKRVSILEHLHKVDEAIERGIAHGGREETR